MLTCEAFSALEISQSNRHLNHSFQVYEQRDQCCCTFNFKDWMWSRILAENTSYWQIFFKLSKAYSSQTQCSLFYWSGRAFGQIAAVFIHLHFRDNGQKGQSQSIQRYLQRKTWSRASLFTKNCLTFLLADWNNRIVTFTRHGDCWQTAYQVSDS